MALDATAQDPVVSDTGLSTVDKLAQIWLQYQTGKQAVDIERSQDTNKQPDRVAVATGAAPNPGAVASKVNWTYIGLGLAGVLGVVLLLKLAR